MRWMDIAWSDVGVEETSGAAASSDIIAYFRDVGRGDITSDETAWCAAFVGACLSRSGIETGIPEGDRLLARSFLSVGTPIDEPRVGAIVVFERPPHAWSGHVGFVSGVAGDSVMVLGGNQKNAVNVARYSKARVLGYRWPEAAKSVADVAAEGSRTVKAAKQARGDVVKAAGAVAVAQADGGKLINDLTGLSAKAAELQGAISGVADFASFAVGNLATILGVLGLYWAARIVWAQGWIARFRTDDANTGKHTGRA